MSRAQAQLWESLERESLRSRRGVEAVVKRDEQDPLADLVLEVQTAGELDRVPGPQRMPEQQALRISGEIRCQFHENTGREIAGEPAGGAITLGGCERPLACSAGEG
jgi:hypothetical protein